MTARAVKIRDVVKDVVKDASVKRLKDWEMISGISSSPVGLVPQATWRAPPWQAPQRGKSKRDDAVCLAHHNVCT